MFRGDVKIWPQPGASEAPKHQAYLFNGNGFESLVIAAAKEVHPEPLKDRTLVPAPRTL